MGVAHGPSLTNGRRLVRALSVALFGGGLALAAARVIGSNFEPVFFAPVGLAVFTGWAVSRLPVPVRVLGYAAVFLGSAVVVGAVADASPGVVWHGLVDGPRQVLTTNWPSPPWPTIFVALGVFISVVVAVATDVAMRLRWRALALVPLIAGLAALLAVAAPSGAQWAPLACAAAATFALLWIGLDDRVVSLRAGAVVAGAVGAAVLAATLSIAIADRADPRFVQAAQEQLALLDPLAAVDAQLRSDVVQSMYTVESADLGLLPRWRTTTLDMYDGVSWSATGRLAPIGNLVDRGSGAKQVTVTVSAKNGAELWVVPGSLLRTTQPVETDTDRRVVRILGAARPVASTFVVEPLEAFEPSAAGSMPVTVPTEIEQSFRQRARTLAGDGSVAQQVAQLAAALRDQYQLDQTSPGGIQEGLINVFLADGRIGNRSQFVTAFVLMARSLGVDARVAVGYELVGTTGSRADLTTKNAAVWPEVRTAEGWTQIDVFPVAGDVVPATGASAEQEQTPAAPQPAIPPETETNNDNGPTTDPPVVAASDNWRTVRVWGLRVGIGLGLLLWPVVTFAGVVGWLKHRRRRGLKAVDPARRVTTAWTLATDALVDAGAELHASHTNVELVHAGVQAQPDAGLPLGRLQRHADAVTFASAYCDEDRAADAVDQLLTVESSIMSSSSWWWRWKWALSTRSLRKRTQSPLRSPAIRRRR